MFVQNIKGKCAGCLLGVIVVSTCVPCVASPAAGSEETMNVAVVRALPAKLDSSTFGGVTIKGKTTQRCVSDLDNIETKRDQILFENPGKGDRLAAAECVPLP